MAQNQNSAEHLNTIDITDPADPRLSDYRDLTDLQLRTKMEEPEGLFIAEGHIAIGRAIAAGYQMRSMLIDAKRVPQYGDLCAQAPLYVAAPDVLESITGFQVHRGTLASFHRKPLPEPSELLPTVKRLVVLENINNHTNIGAIFRVVAGLGFDGIVLSRTCADPLYRRSVRVSMGEVFSIPYTYLDDWEEGLQGLKDAGFTLLGLSPSQGSCDIRELTDEQKARPAVLFGAEGPGLSDRALAACDQKVIIPMHAGVDSLNVAAATAVTCWELAR